MQPKAPGPLGGFGRVLIQDGASFAVKDTLHGQYPGRFNKQKPAAVERHVTMSLPEESVEQVTLTADTAAERPHLPSPETRCGDLPLADYGHSDPGHPDAVDRSGGSFVVRRSGSPARICMRSIRATRGLRKGGYGWRLRRRC